jgi:hypothetical protein
MLLQIDHDRRFFALLIYDKLNTFHANTSKFASVYLSGNPKSDGVRDERARAAAP